MYYEFLCFIRQQNSVKWEKKIKVNSILKGTRIRGQSGLFIDSD